MDRIIKLELSANRKKILLINDLVPALILLVTGFQSAQAGTMNAVTIVNIVSGGLLATFGLREWRSLGRHHRDTVQWYDFVSGAVMMLNAATMYKPWKGFQPANLYFAVSLLLLLKSFSIVKPLSLFARLAAPNQALSLILQADGDVSPAPRLRTLSTQWRVV